MFKNSIYKGGKAMQKWIIFIIIAVIIVILTFVVLNVNIETEYTPETEIEDVELRKTIITLYFKDKTSGELAKETRLIDSKELLRNPYQTLLNFLLKGPENNNYEKAIPEGTTILETSFENGCVTINMSKEFQESNLDSSQLNNAIYSIFNTLSELTEVTSIKILVDNNEVEGISEIITKIKSDNQVENNSVNELEEQKNIAAENNSL